MDFGSPITHAELMAWFGVGQDAVVRRDVLELVPRGPRHQARLRGGTRVRIRGLVPVDDRLLYQVETCDRRGRASGWWAFVAEEDLLDAPDLDLLAWLRAR